MEPSPSSPTLHLDLSNFEEERGSRYVLTSPRSLEACARLGIRPVDLLPRTREELQAEYPGASMKVVDELYRASEKDRRSRLTLCKDLRRELIESEGRARIHKDGGQGGLFRLQHPNTERWHHTESRPRVGSQQTSLRRTLSLGDLSSPEVQVKKVAKKVEGEAKVIVSERDKKIAALMLLKHQEEERDRRRKLVAEQAWQDVKHQERTFKELLRHYETLDRGPTTHLGDLHLDTVLEVAGMRGKNLTAKEKTRLHPGSTRVGRMAGDNKVPHQEKLIQAIKTKLVREVQNKKSIQMKNQYETLRHSQRKGVVDSQAKAEELLKKMTIKEKEEKAQELHKLVCNERSQGLKEKAAREEEQIHMAKTRAEKQQREQMKHKKMLAQHSNQKIRQATDSQEKNIQSRVERTREQNLVKQRNHNFLKQKLEEEEENHRKVVEKIIVLKNRKSDILIKDREATVEEGKKIARASFQMRDKIRQKTKGRTFDQMVLDAQINFQNIGVADPCL
uniref:Coiled-coil domain-containing protein 185 n=1 Tax=Leptobrachium leishanense TaxID=445787 RepID=A0A8C5PE31_9ANUR